MGKSPNSVPRGITARAGTQGAGQIDDGKYALSDEDGPALGTNRVEIRAPRKICKMEQKPRAPPGVINEWIVEAILPRFNPASTLKTEIKPGENRADFKLESK